jgi:putative FmdB family regulatory protein
MPTYNYKCPQCDHRFEARHGMSEDAPPCPNCQYVTVQRVIVSAPAISGGMMTHAGDGHKASKEQLQGKWAEETPKLRKKLEDKLGKETVRRNAPSLYNNSG